MSTCDGVVRIPWDEVVYPKLLHNPTDPLSSLEHPSADPPAPDYLSPTTGGLGLGWGSSSGEADSWSWDEEDDLPPDGDEAEIESALGRLRQDHLAADSSGDYVELLEPRGGPDGGADPKQRYLEMHGICKTKTLPLCRRSKAVRIRKGKAWGYGRGDLGGRTGSLGRRDSNNSGKESRGTCKDWVNSRPLPRVIDLARERRSCPPCLQDSDEHGIDPVGQENSGLYLKGPFKERRPGVGKEREGAGSTLPWDDSHKERVSNSRRSSGFEDVSKDIHKTDKVGVDRSNQDPGLHTDSVFEDKSLSGTLDIGSKATVETGKAITGAETAGTQITDKAVSDSKRPMTNGSETNLKPLKDSSCKRESKCSDSTTKESGKSKEMGRVSQQGTDNGIGERHAGKSEERVCPRGKEVKAGGFRAPRYNISAEGSQRQTLTRVDVIEL